MGWSEVGDTVCPIARALAVVGDRWTVLILRELFLGVKRFEEFQQQTGMSPHLLSTRLKRLEAEGIVVRRPYSERPVRHEYRLTDKGKDLFGVLYAMRGWAERWAYVDGETGGGPAMRYIHRACGTDVGTAMVCPGCGAPLGYGDLKGEPSPALKAEQAARAG